MENILPHATYSNQSPPAAITVEVIERLGAALFWAQVAVLIPMVAL